MMKRILATLASTTLLALAPLSGASAASNVYVYQGKDVAWSQPGARAVAVMDRECDGTNVWVRYQLKNRTSGKLLDKDGCMNGGRARVNLPSKVWKIRVCEGDGTALCSKWKLVTP